MLLLAGDIGGTKTNLAIYSFEQGLRVPLAEATFRSACFQSLEAIVSEFLGPIELKVTHATFGVAGPVVAGRAKITNLPWLLDEAQLQSALGLVSVRLINDVAALANAVPALEPADLLTLNAGSPVQEEAIAVIAPGTGLGEAFLIWDGSHYRVCASEGGHADFAPTNQREVALLSYLQDRFEHVSYEVVCSGHGITNIYDYLKDTGQANEPAWLAQEQAAAHDRVPLIIQHALSDVNPCELCVTTLDTFISILGAEAGNLALKVLAVGGVYLGGGILPRIVSAMRSERFSAAFRRKGRMADLLARMPLHIIGNPKAGLLGAAGYGLRIGLTGRLPGLEPKNR
jgi:glucokinase